MNSPYEEIQTLKLKLAEAEKRADFYKLIADHTSDWEVFRDANGKIIYINSAFERITGFSKDDILSGKITEKDVVHPEDRDTTLANIKKSTQQLDVFDFEFRIIRFDGVIRSINLNAVSVFQDGKFIGTRTSARDITDQKKLLEIKQLHQSLNEAKDKFRTYIQSSPISVFQADDNGNYTFVNPAACTLLGYSEEELLHMSIQDIQPKEFLEKGFENFQEVKQNGISKNFEMPFLRKDGSHVDIVLDATKIADNEYIAYVKDISNLKKIERELLNQNHEYPALNEEYKTSIDELHKAKELTEESETRLKEAQRLAKIGHWELDVKENTLKWSDEIYRIFGANPQQFGANYEAFMSFVHPDDRELVNNAYFEHVKTQKKYDIVHRVLLPTGELKYVNERCESEFGDDGQAVKSIGTVADITERIEIQLELEAAKARAEESDMLKTSFLQNLSHEIRTPMNAINGFAQMLQHQDISPEKQKNFVQIIQKNTEQLLTIVSDVLTIASIQTKQEKIQLEQISLNNLLTELLTEFSTRADEKNIALYLHRNLSDEDSKIYSDRAKLSQIFSNLLSNALKFTFRGNVEFGNEIIENQDIKQIRFYVKDTGIGIPFDVHDKIFYHFRQADTQIGTTYGGTGLGLSISKGYAELLGGKIWVNSVLNEGSTFYFTIPYKPVNLNINQQKPHTQTIILAEDEIYNFMYIEELLAGSDIKLLHATNGIRAIELAKENPTTNLILMDIRMPVMDGFTAAIEIKKLFPEMKIIALSAYARAEEIKTYCTIFDSFLTKPVNRTKILDLIQKYLTLAASG